MSRISPGAALTVVIKSRLASADYLRAPSSQQTSDEGKINTKRKQSLEDAAKANLLRKIGTIERTDPDGKRKAFRYFLEGVLNLEFGRHMREEEVSFLVDSTILRMLADKGLEADMSSAGEKLFQAAKP